MIDRRLAAAERYADYDKSDPFALARAKTHIANALLRTLMPKEKRHSTMPRLSKRCECYRRTEYPVTVYRNITRP